ncbi:MAG: type II toxin-antitoxin system VapC family toxin [Promethearchaeota archaeon]
MILVDTNVIIDIERGKSSLNEIISQFPKESFCLSEISIMELYSGLGYAKEKKGEEFFKKQKEIIDIILYDFNHIPINQSILKDAGLKRGELQNHGVIIDNEDILIGITGEFLEVTGIITRNPDHFQHFNIKIFPYSNK